MKTRTLIASFVLISAGALSLGLAAQEVRPKPTEPSKTAGGDIFAIDSVHSSVIFKIQHMGLANFYGRFNDISGSYTIDNAKPENSSFDISVATESVDTKAGKRDDHLRSPDFFNASEFPAITFKSTKVASAGTNQLTVTGDLSMHGVTKPITVNMTLAPAKDTGHGVKGAVETTFTVKRTDFDIDPSVAQGGGLGDDVTITVALEGGKR